MKSHLKVTSSEQMWFIYDTLSLVGVGGSSLSQILNTSLYVDQFVGGVPKGI